ncbi:MAG: PTS system beta-glucoside-specific EIIBCA component [Candidatus Celerinatantimonas neptuna]|nr:MAG: PTS system beta-glucoside-specific EIIBCA component [Candidatus Celerinatantimonas neptuna]
MDYSQLINEILENIGGCKNIHSVTHCATRLRFILKKPDLANSDILKKNPHIIMVVNGIGQYQLVIGPEVSDVYEELIKKCPQFTTYLPTMPGLRSPFSRLIITITEAFKPFINILLICALIKATIIALSLTGILPDNGTYRILFATSESLFYFMPILLAYTMAKQFKTNPYVAMAISAALLHPTSAEPLEFLSNTATLFHAHNEIFSHGLSVLPLLALIWALSFIQKQLEQRLFITIRTLFVPTICILVFVPIIFVVIAPVGRLLGLLIIDFYHYLYTEHPLITELFIAGLWPMISLFGLQWTFTAIILTHFYIYGYDPLLPVIACALIGQSGAAAGLLFKKNQKNRVFKGIASCISLCGIIEPVLYGCNLPDKKALIFGSLGAVTGSVAMMMDHLTSQINTLPGLFLLIQYSNTHSSVLILLLGFSLSFLVAMIGRYIWPDHHDITQSDSTAEALTNNNQKETAKSQLIPCPLTGRLIQQNEIDDFIFSGNILGTGVAIYPDHNILYSPINGKVERVFEGHHAISLISHDGIQILIHIGLKTVQLTGKYFSSLVSADQNIHVGQPLIQFDHVAIMQAGFDLTTPILVTNSHLYQRIDPAQFSHINLCSPLLVLTNDEIPDQNSQCSNSSG